MRKETQINKVRNEKGEIKKLPRKFTDLNVIQNINKSKNKSIVSIHADNI
jgi:hypothetical protein